MSNNYAKGVRWEREVMKTFELLGWECTRAAGSHSKWDVIAYRPDRKPMMVQCKVTTRPAEAKRLAEKFKESTIPSEFYNQSIKIKAGRGMNQLLEVII